jgi:hypothetical protein
VLKESEKGHVETKSREKLATRIIKKGKEAFFEERMIRNFF